MEIKIWSVELYRSKQRGIVAAASQKRAVELLNEYGEGANLSTLQNYSGLGGPLSKDVAGGRGEGLWVTKESSSDDAKDWKRVIGKDPEGFKSKPRAKRHDDDDLKEKHPAFGMVGISKWSSGGDQKFFGSAVRSSNGIALRIHRAKVVHSLNEDRYFEEERIIDVEMTPAQFIDLIMSPNEGSGVPCTIRYADGKLAPPIPEASKTEPEKIADDFRQKANRLGSQLNGLIKVAKEKLEAPGTLKKSDKKDILDAVDRLVCEIQHNMPFYLTQLQEATQRTVTQAKSEVSAFVSSELRKAGLESLKDRAPKLDYGGGK